MNVALLIRALIVVATVVYWVAVVPISAARTFDLTTASIADINAAFDAGALTSERLTQLYLARIAAYDKVGPKLNAVLKINPNAAEEARGLDAERRARGPRGPLHGIPILLKANIDVAGWPATAVSLPFGILWPRSMQNRPDAFAVPDV